MTTLNLSSQNNSVPGRIFEATYSSNSTQDWVILDNLMPGEQITVGLIISSGQGYVDYAIESPATVIAGNATAIQWTKGVVTATAVTYFPSSTTAIRAVRSSGTIKLVISR